MYTLPIALTQVVAAMLLALSARTGFLHIGVLCVPVIAAALAFQMMVAKSYWHIFATVLGLCACFVIGGVYPFALCLCAIPAGTVLCLMIKKKQTIGL